MVRLCFGKISYYFAIVDMVIIISIIYATIVVINCIIKDYLGRGILIIAKIFIPGFITSNFVAPIYTGIIILI